MNGTSVRVAGDITTKIYEQMEINIALFSANNYLQFAFDNITEHNAPYKCALIKIVLALRAACRFYEVQMHSFNVPTPKSKANDVEMRPNQYIFQSLPLSLAFLYVYIFTSWNSIESVSLFDWIV